MILINNRADEGEDSEPTDGDWKTYNVPTQPVLAHGMMSANQ